MSRKRQPKIVRTSRNSGRTVSVILHALLLLLAFLPFLSMQTPQEPTKEALVIQFDYPFNQFVKAEKFVEETPPETDMDMDMEEASKMSGSEAGGSPVSAEARQSRPVEAAPAKITTPTVTSVSRTSSSSTLTSTKSDIPLPQPKIVNKQAWQSVNDFDSFEADGVEELKIIDWSDGAGSNDVGASEPAGDDDSSVFSDGYGTGTGGTGGTGGGQGNGTGSGSGPGGGTGTGSAGKNTGVGNDGTGMEWGVGLGKGFDREVIKRGNVGSLAVKEGHISVSLCVDRSGKVIRTKYNSMGSNLREPDLIRKAEAMAATYIFAPDETAPVEQCGTLTFIFKFK